MEILRIFLEEESSFEILSKSVSFYEKLNCFTFFFPEDDIWHLFILFHLS
jgi:hypothetical protein